MSLRLAAILGRTVEELMTGVRGAMSSRELTLWQAFDLIQPLGDVRGELHAAMIASTIANASGRTMPKGQTIDFRDFLWWSGRSKQERNSRELMSRLVQMGARIIKRGGDKWPRSEPSKSTSKPGLPTSSAASIKSTKSSAASANHSKDSAT